MKDGITHGAALVAGYSKSSIGSRVGVVAHVEVAEEVVGVWEEVIVRELFVR
jgi:hypothetical protein